VITAEPIIRLGWFMGALLLMALWELLAPRRPQSIRRTLRWPNNFALVMLDTIVLRLLLAFAALDVAFLAQAKGWGLFNMIPLPAWLVIAAAVVLLDPAAYGQHVVSRDRSNFGCNLPWRDHMFRTYRDLAALGHHRMSLGIDRFREPRELWLDRMRWQPLRRDVPARDRS
jgi:sterol desaturase/sphingolipid hydroxylase (fatty acid hydroxylase superfamily)